MKKKLFVVNRLTDYCDGDREEKESMCVFYGTEKEASRIETEYGTQSCRAWGVWLEVEEVEMTSDIVEALKCCGYEMPKTKILSVTFWKQQDGIYVYKKRVDMSEDEVTPRSRKIAFASTEFANVIRNIAYQMQDLANHGIRWRVIVNYRRTDNLVDEEEFQQIVDDIYNPVELEFRCE